MVIAEQTMLQPAVCGDDWRGRAKQMRRSRGAPRQLGQGKDSLPDASEQTSIVDENNYISRQ